MIGQPRKTRIRNDSRMLPGGAFDATTRPTTTGTNSASPSHTSRRITNARDAIVKRDERQQQRGDLRQRDAEK